MNEETDNQIDPSVIDDMPDSVKRSLAEFINKKGGNIPVPEKKGSTGVTNTKILRVLTGSLQKVQGQLTTIDNRLAQQNALIQSNLTLTGGLLNAIEAQDSLLASKIDALTDAYEAQNELLAKQADLAEDRRAEARLEEVFDNTSLERYDGENVSGISPNVLKYALRGIYRFLNRKGPLGAGVSAGKRLSQIGKKITGSELGLRLLGGRGQVIASRIGRFGSKLLSGPQANLAKGLVTKAIIKSAPYTIGLGLNAYNLVQYGRVAFERALKDSLKSDLPKVLGSELGTRAAREITKKSVPEIASKTLQRTGAKEILEAGGKKIAKKGGTKALQKRLGRAGFNRGAAVAGKSLTQQMYERALKKNAAAMPTDMMVRNLASSGNPLQRALASPKVQRLIIQKIGEKKAAAFTAKAASKAVPFLGTAVGGVEGIARGLMGDWKGMMLSFGGAVPGVGIGFAAIDILRDINREAYERHIEPNLLPFPSDENFSGFFMDALGVGPDEYETGGVTKPGTAILHGTELIAHKNADPATALYSPIISGILGSTTAYMRQAGPSASYIAPLYNREAGKLSRQFGITHVNAVSGTGGSFVGMGSRMDQYEKKAEAEKPYYGPAGGPEGEDGEPQANKEGFLGMVARFFGFPMRSGEDVNSDFANLGAMDSREGLSDGDPTGGSKTAGDLGTHLKGLKDKLPVTGQIHRHPDHPPWSQSGGHSAMSLHYSGRALDIGGYSPSTPQNGDYPGASGTDEQAPVIREIIKWNKAKGVSPVELVHGSPAYRGTGSYREYPDSHHHHVHIAYKNGGLTYDKPHVALMGEEGEEIVIPHPQSTGVARDHLLAVADAQTQKEVVSAYAKFTPDILMYDEEEEQQQTTFIINMTQPAMSASVDQAPLKNHATGGRMHSASRSLILQSLY